MENDFWEAEKEFQKSFTSKDIYGMNEEDIKKQLEEGTRKLRDFGPHKVGEDKNRKGELKKYIELRELIEKEKSELTGEYQRPFDIMLEIINKKIEKLNNE